MMLRRWASELRATPERGWGSIPRIAPKARVSRVAGRSGDARQCRRASVFAFRVCAAMPAWATHHADAFAEIPEGLSVVLFSTYEDPNVVTYDPDMLKPESLITFANDLWGHDKAIIEPVSAFLLQKIQGRNRAHIFCLGEPK